eukprot:gene7240-11558_t
MKIWIYLLCVLLLSFSIHSAIVYTGPRIFYTNSQKNKLVGTESAALTISGCSCKEFTLLSCNATQVGNTVTVELEIPTTNYGFCDLQLKPNNEPFAKIAFLDELSLSPPIGNSVGNTNLTLDSTPSLTTVQFNDLLNSPSITLFYEPAQNLLSNSDTQYILTSPVKLNAKTYSSSSSTNEWDVEFVLQDTINSVTQKYPISQPFVVYVDTSVNLTSVEPKLVTVGYKTKITIKGVNFISGNTKVDIKLGTNEITGSVIDSQTIETEHSFPLGFSNQDVSVAISFDGKNTWQTSSLIIRTIGKSKNILLTNFKEYPSNLAVSYSAATFPEEVGCSVVGFNNFSLNLFNEIPSSLKGNVTLDIYDFTFSQTVTCVYDTDKIICPCPKIHELSIILPHSYKFKLKLNGVDSVPTQLATSKPVLTFFKPSKLQKLFTFLESFSFTPIGKIASDIATPLIFSGLENLYTSDLTYTWYLRNKMTGSNVRISPNCMVDTSSGVKFNCSDMSFLISSNKNELPGTKTDDGKLTIETVCGCKFVDLTGSSSLCPESEMIINGQCCQNETITFNTTMNGTMNGNSTFNSTITNTTTTGNLTCYTPCISSCELYPVLKIGNNQDNSGGFEASQPFHFYPKMRVTSMTPNAIVLNTQRNITITGGPFVKNSFSIEFRPLQNDPYDITQQLGVLSNSSNVTHPKAIPVELNFINSSAVSIVNPLLSNEVGYEIYLSNNNASYSSVSNFHFRSYNLSRTQFTKIVGDQGIERSTPGGSSIYIEGSGFFPSSLIKIRYSSGILKFDNTCLFVSSTNITCQTNNVYSTGISLPKEFDVTMSMNGYDYIDTQLKLTFLESEVPVIVQVVPSKGPMIPDETYSLFIKGITKNIDRCVWSPKSKSRTYETIPDTDSASDTEIKCNVPTDQITPPESTMYGIWNLYLRSTVTGQESPSVEITLYPKPTILKISPTSGTAFGGTPIEFFGSGFTLPGSGLDLNAFKMTFKLTETRSSFDCTIHNDTYSVCIAPSHPEDKDAQISISFNENQFFKWQGAGSSTYEVLSCDKGLAGKDFEAPCTPCVAGMFKPLRGFFDCIKCTANTYQPLQRSEICNQCPPRTISIPGSTNITDCDCEPGTWRPFNSTSGIECDVCVDGGRCDGADSLPYPKIGYYWDRSTGQTDPYKFVQCKVEVYCTGNVTNGQEGCVVGRTGLLCEECAAGYFKSSGNCELCNTEVQWRMIVVISFLVVLILLFFKFAQLKVSHLSSFSIASSYYQIIAVFSAYNFKWPAGLKNVLGYMKFLNLDLDIFVPECISVITYAMKWAATICLPIMFGALLFLGFLLEAARSLLAKLWGPAIRRILRRFYHVNRQNWLTKQFSLTIIAGIEFFAAPKTMKELSEFGDKCIHTFVIVLSFSYVFVVTKASQIFNCTEIQGVLRMDSERTVICFQNDWWAYLPFAVITLVTFGLVTDFILQWTEDQKEVRKRKKMLELDAGYENEMDIHLDEYDVELAKFGLKRRLNQATTIVDKNGKEILTTEQPLEDDLQPEKKNEISVQHKDQDETVIQRENLDSSTNTITGYPSDSTLLKGGNIQEIELSDVDLSRQNESQENFNESQERLNESGIAEVEE